MTVSLYLMCAAMAAAMFAKTADIASTCKHVSIHGEMNEMATRHMKKHGFVNACLINYCIYGAYVYAVAVVQSLIGNPVSIGLWIVLLGMEAYSHYCAYRLNTYGKVNWWTSQLIQALTAYQARARKRALKKRAKGGGLTPAEQRQKELLDDLRAEKELLRTAFAVTREPVPAEPSWLELPPGQLCEDDLDWESLWRDKKAL